MPAGAGLEARRRWSYVWGYGYYIPFAALAALGAGLEVAVEASVGHAGELGVRAVVAAVVIPIATVIVMVELLRVPAGSARIRPMTIAALLALYVVVAASDRIGLATGFVLVAVTVTAAVAVDAVAPRRSVAAIAASMVEGPRDSGR